MRRSTVVLLLTPEETGSRSPHDSRRRETDAAPRGAECIRKREHAALGAISERAAQSDFREVIN